MKTFLPLGIVSNYERPDTHPLSPSLAGLKCVFWSMLSTDSILSALLVFYSNSMLLGEASQPFAQDLKLRPSQYGN